MTSVAYVFIILFLESYSNNRTRLLSIVSVNGANDIQKLATECYSKSAYSLHEILSVVVYNRRSVEPNNVMSCA